MCVERKRRLKEQFIISIHDKDMMTEMIRKLTTIQKTNEVITEQVLVWAEG